MSSTSSKLAVLGIALSLMLTILPMAGLAQTHAKEADETLTPAYPEGWTDDIPSQAPKPAPSIRPWWETTTRDLDRDGIVDWLEGRTEPYPVGVSYDHLVTERDQARLEELGYEVKARTNDALLIGLADPAAYATLAALPGAVMVEPYGKGVFYGDVQTAATKARNSTDYPVGAWDLGVTGKGVNLAVVDTGIDDGHPGLQGKFVAGFDAVCTDDEACVLTLGRGSGDYGVLRQQEDGGFNPDDKNQHGTACSGMATATGYDPHGPEPDGKYMGAAPDTRLVDVRIGTRAGAGPFENYALEQEFYESAMNGLSWTIDHVDGDWPGVPEELWGIDIISLSWGITSHEQGGSDGTDMHSRRLDQAVEAGIVVSVAAGNDGPDNDGLSGMGSSSLSITIGALDDLNTILRDDDIIAGYSSRGPRRDNDDGYPYDELKPDIVVPGTHIIQAQACTTDTPARCDAQDNSYSGRGSGTSYATPQAAGIMALLLEVNTNLTPAHIKEILRYTAERRGTATFPELDPFWNKDFGWGMVDALEAVKLAQLIDDEYLAGVDVELQAHVMEENLTNYTAGERTVSGLAWARVGTVEKVEVSLDGVNWWETMYNGTPEGAGTGDYIQWRVEVPPSAIPFTGNQTLRVRAISGEHHSLPDTVEFYATAQEHGEGSNHTGLLLALMGAIVLGGLLYLAAVADKQEEVVPEVLDAEQ